MTVTHRTKTIDGVPVRRRRRPALPRGHLEERTTDWYAQDAQGNVWYFGEDTAELDAHGQVTSTRGHLAGRASTARGRGSSCRPHPRVGPDRPPGVLKGHAEDHFKVLALHASVTTTLGRAALLTRSGRRSSRA